MVIYLSRSQTNIEVPILLPAEPDVVQPIITQLNECGIGEGPVKIVGTLFCQIPNLTQYIACADLGQAADLQKLNALSGLVDRMDAEKHRTFSVALDAEPVNGLDDVLKIADNVGQYEFIEGVTCDKELGGWLVEHGQAGIDFPAAVRPYLNYAGIGAEYYANHGGAYTPSGYVKRREAVQESTWEAIQQQAVENPSKFSLTLTSPTGTCRLHLPASEDKLEQVKFVLGLDSLDSAAISDVKIDYTWSHLLPMDGITLEDANTLAECVQAMTGQELRVFGAVLEVEEPRSFRDAGTIAMDCDDYELVSGSEREYGMEALRYAGAGDEILELLDGFTDFDALGRSEMELDGVRESSYGPVKRLSVPWPEQAEQGQTMC